MAAGTLTMVGRGRDVQQAEAHIAEFARQRRTTHAALNAAHATRGGSAPAEARWRASLDRFYASQAPVDALMTRSCGAQGGQDPESRAFIFGWIRADPWFFRSGYILQTLLRRLKKLDLTVAEKADLQELILARIRNGGRREFRHLCRLIPKIADDSFRANLHALAANGDPSQRHRAALALRYLPGPDPYAVRAQAAAGRRAGASRIGRWISAEKAPTPTPIHQT